MALVLLGGCAVGGEEIAGASPEPRAGLAAKAEVAAENAAQAGPQGPGGRQRHEAASRDDKANGPGSAGDAGPREKYVGASADMDSQQTGPESPSASRPDASWAGLADLEDPAADHGNGPGYADLAAVTFRERGDDLGVSVTMRSVVPGTLADREVQGVGIDLFRSSSDESDYQVFLDGGRHGWRAFLQTPDGFVDFPGTFAVERRTLHVTVPWQAVGGRERAEVSVFVDWSSGVGRLSTDGATRVELP
jgi:hypothetical protein